MTSFPELMVSLVAIYDKTPSIVVGNVVGSNIANTALIVGVCACISKIFFDKSALSISLFILGISFLTTLLGYISNVLSFLDGVILISFLLVFLYFSFFYKKKEKGKSKPKKGAGKHLLLMIRDTVFVIISAKLLIYSAKNIALELQVSELFISLSLIALGTSLPELVTSIVALKKGQNDICIGNVLGSNIYNILLVLGFSCLVSPLPIADEYISREFLWLCLIAFICSLLFFIYRKRQYLGWGSGLVLLSLYFCFIYSIIPSEA